jgi:hypothetical protein
MRLFLIAVTLLLAFLMIGCSDDPTDTPVDDGNDNAAAADSIGGVWMEAFADTLRAWEDLDLEYEDIKDLDMTEMRTGFEAALAEDDGSGIGHLGLALVTMMELNYSQQLWAFLDSLEAHVADNGPDDPVVPPMNLATPLRDGLIGHQFRILAEAPLALVAQTAELPDNLTMTELQRILNEDLLPRIAVALDHLAEVEADADFEYQGVVDDEDFEIDLGEVYFFDASLRVLRSGLRVLLGYNLELTDLDGSYDWLLDLEDIDRGYDTYVVEDTVPHDILHLYQVWERAQSDSLALALLHTNLVEDGPLLTLRDDPYSGQTMLQQAGVDLNTAVDKLEAAVSYIRAESDNQGDDVIHLSLLTDWDTDIDECEDCPNFTAGWDEIEDVIAWIREVLDGPYLLEENIDGRDISVTVDLYQFFSDPVDDWKTLLPAHEWNPADQWLVREVHPIYWFDHDFNNDFTFWHRGPDMEESEEVTVSGISRVYFYDVSESIDEPMTLLDDLGFPLVTDVLPYFPDYTFHGLLPGMDRAGLAELTDLLEQAL